MKFNENCADCRHLICLNSGGCAVCVRCDNNLTLTAKGIIYSKQLYQRVHQEDLDSLKQEDTQLTIEETFSLEVPKEKVEEVLTEAEVLEGNSKAMKLLKQIEKLSPEDREYLLENCRKH